MQKAWLVPWCGKACQGIRGQFVVIKCTWFWYPVCGAAAVCAEGMEGHAKSAAAQGDPTPPKLSAETAGIFSNAALF